MMRDTERREQKRREQSSASPTQYAGSGGPADWTPATVPVSHFPIPRIIRDQYGQTHNSVNITVLRPPVPLYEKSRVQAAEGREESREQRALTPKTDAFPCTFETLPSPCRRSDMSRGESRKQNAGSEAQKRCRSKGMAQPPCRLVCCLSLPFATMISNFASSQRRGNVAKGRESARKGGERQRKCTLCAPR